MCQGATVCFSFALCTVKSDLREVLNIRLIKELQSNIRAVANANEINSFIIDSRTYLFFTNTEVGFIIFDIPRRTANGTDVWNFFGSFKPQHLIQTHHCGVKIGYGSVSALFKRYASGSKENYLVKYQQEVIDRYSDLVDEKVQPTQIKGWNEFFAHSTDDLLLFVFAILVGTIISMTEWDNGTYTILIMTARGRKSIWAKISILAVISFVAVLAINFSTLLGIAFRFGLSFPNADICSVIQFAYCPYDWSILTHLTFTMVIKAINLMGLMLLSAVVSAFFKSYLVSIFVSSGAVVVGYYLSNLEAKNEWVYLNSYAAGLTDPFFERYRAISVMGIPVSILTLVIVAIIFLCLALMIVYAFGFFQGTENTLFSKIEKGAVSIYYLCKEKLFSIIPRRAPKRRSLLLTEVKKSFVKSHLIILCVIMLLIKIGYADETKPHVDYWEEHYKEVCYSYMGDLTDEKRESIEIVLAESQAVMSKMSAMRNAVVNGTITSTEYNAYMEEYQLASLNHSSYGRLKQQCARIDAAAEKGIKAELTYDSGWIYFFSQGIDVVLLAFLLLFLSGIYRMEYQNGFDRIAATTSRGIGALNKNKLLLSVIVSAIAFVIYSGVDMAIAIQSYSFPNAGIALASVKLTSIPISIWMAIALKFAVGLIIVVAFATLTCIISRLLKRTYLTIPFVLLVIVGLISAQSLFF